MDRNECRRWEVIGSRDRPIARDLSAEFEERFDESMRSFEQDEDEDEDLHDPSFSDDLASVSSCAETTPTDVDDDKSTKLDDLLIKEKLPQSGEDLVVDNSVSIKKIGMKKCKAKHHLKTECPDDNEEFGDDMDYQEIDDDEICDDDDFEDDDEDELANGARSDEV